MGTHSLFKLISTYKKPQVVAEVIGLNGSAPRHVSSRMAIREDGSTFGSVGGGIVEAKTLEAARQCFADRISKVIQVGMQGDIEEDFDPICGGIIDISIEYVEDTSLYDGIVEHAERGHPVVLASGSQAPSIGLFALLLYDEDSDQWMVEKKRSSDFRPDSLTATAVLSKGKPVVSPVDGLLYELAEPTEQLLILGGGYVGRSLAMAAEGLGFEVTVADFRSQFAVQERFAPNIQVIHAPFLEAIENYEFTASTYVVVVSPGHVHDFECVRAILGKPYRYAGFIGSKAKTRKVLAQLEAQGFSREKVQALCAPIGIDIGAETPQEIAISILAEIIAVRRNSPAAMAIASDRPRRRGQDYRLY
jgi:xanthine dehydrogenase accessory factor